MKFILPNRKLQLCLSLQLLILFVLSLSAVELYSQDIVRFKDKFPIKTYEAYIELEKEALEESDFLRKASIYEQIGKGSIELDEDLAITLFDKGMDAAIAASNDSVIAHIWMEGSVPFINKGQYDIADERLSKAFDYWHNSGASLDLAYCHILQGYLERLQGQHYLALDNLYKAKAIQSKYLEPYEMWNVTNRIMINYSGLGDFQAALDIAEEYIEQSEEGKGTSGYNLIIMNSSDYYFELENYPKAKEYIEVVLPPLREAQYPKFLVSIYSKLSRIATVEGDLELANDYADSSIVYAEKFNVPESMRRAYLRKYETLTDLGLDEDRLYYLEKGYESALETNRKSSVLRASKLFSEYESSRSRYESAYNYLVIVDSLREEIFSEELTAELDDLEKRLLLEKSQEEIDMLSEQNELKTQNIEKASRLRKFLLALLGLALASCALIYLLLRQRSNYNNSLEKKNAIISNSLEEKELLLREIHHRVKNNLQFISSLLRLQSDHVTDPTALGALQQGHDRVRSMALIHQDLYKEDNLTGVDSKKYFTKLITGLFKSNNIHEERIKLDLDVESLNLDVDLSLIHI